MCTPILMVAATLASTFPAGPQKQAAGPAQQYETLEDLFDSNTGTWTSVPVTTTAMEEPEPGDLASESLYKPIVRETLKTPPPQPWLLSFPFNTTR